MSDLSYLTNVEHQYLAWERAAREDIERQLQLTLNLPLAMLPTDLFWRILESPIPDSLDCCDAWSCGFVDREGAAL